MKIIKVKIPMSEETLKPIPINDEALKLAQELSDMIYNKLMQEEAKIIVETILKVRKIKKDEVKE